MRAPGRDRIHVGALLEVLRAVATDGERTTPELAELAGVSRPTLVRLLADAEHTLGVRITWSRAGGYVIEDWGVLDRRAVVRGTPAAPSASSTRCTHT